MLKKAFAKSVVGAAAAGLLVVPVSGTVGFQVDNVACRYEDTTATATDLRLDFAAAPYGMQNQAVVNVTSGAAVPKGRVRVRVDSLGTTAQRLDAGAVTRTLPRTLDAGRTYAVRAQYVGRCRFRESAETAFYTVRRSPVDTSATIRSKRRASFTASLRGAGDLDPRGGRAVFTVKRAGTGKVVRRGVDAVRGGRATADLRDLRRGRYRLVVRYAGTDNYRPAGDTVRFRVGR